MAGDQVRLGIISEIHIVPPGTPDGFWHNPFQFDQAEALFGRAVQRCLDAQVDAIAILGDLTHFADPGSFAGVRRVLEPVELPVYVLPGNHDLDTSDHPLAAFHQALDLPNVIIAPYNVALTPAIDLLLIGLEPNGDPRRYAAVRSRAITGNEATLTVVLTHFPLFEMQTMLSDANLKHAGDLVNREPVLEAVEAIPGPVLVVNGHLHVHATIADEDVLQLSVAALIEPPHDAAVLTIALDDAGQPSVSRQAAGLVDVTGISLPVLSDREETWQFRDGAWLAG